jgi:hypothetical protein
VDVASTRRIDPERLGVTAGHDRRTAFSADDDLHSTIELSATRIRVAGDPIFLAVTAARNS